MPEIESKKERRREGEKEKGEGDKRRSGSENGEYTHRKLFLSISLGSMDIHSQQHT
jgi:hypothetical protein